MSVQYQPVPQFSAIPNRKLPPGTSSAKPPGSKPAGASASDEVMFGGRREPLVGRRRTDGRIEWVPASQAQRDWERMSRWNGGGGGGNGGGDDDDFLTKAIRWIRRNLLGENV